MKNAQKVIDFERPVKQPSSVAERIEQRLVLLRGWLANGIPDGVDLPSSLTTLRKWDVAELGVERIASPNEFTKSHPAHGRQVAEAQRLLGDLIKRHARPTTTKATRNAAADAAEARLNAAAFTRAVSQWHAERDANDKLRTRTEAAQSLSATLRRENAEKDALIADLTRQLSGRNGMRTVN